MLFTILFTALTFLILEDFKEKKDKRIFILLPLMFFWANLHGAFIIGNIMIIVYMLGEGLKSILKKAEYTRHELVLFYSAATLALMVSYINPTGWEAFSIALSSKYKFLELGIQEYQSPFSLYINKLSPINYGYVVLAFMFPIILILRNKKMDLTHVTLLTGLFIMAAKTGRYGIYYTSIATMIIGKETDILLQGLFKDRISDRIYGKLTLVFSVVVLLSAILFFIGVFRFERFRAGLTEGPSVPVTAVDFIEENRLPGNILNSHPYGGYVTWRLYPWKKTFIDTRWLNYTLQSEYAWMMGAVESIYSKELPEGKRPLWKRLLDHYNINFILFDTLDVYGNVPRLLLTLAEDEEWVPVYGDFISVIFVKNTPENKAIIAKFKQPEEKVYNMVISIGSQMAIYDRRNPKYLVTLGRTFYEMGRLKDALTAFRYALKRLPRETAIKDRITQIESELKEENRDEKP